jgi:hypothetical protein
MDDEFLPDEFVLDDVPDPGHGPTVTFAGPSDAPPVPHPPPAHPPRARGRGLYVLIGAGLSAAALVGAVLGTRPSMPAQEVESVFVVQSPAAVDISVERRASAAGSAASIAADAPSASATGSATADAEADVSEQAREAKRDSESALEKGHAAQAIEAGERAVALDPSDAEAWLILGAGYDQRGAYAQARRCFATCSRVATRGPRRECAALLR